MDPNAYEIKRALPAGSQPKVGQPPNGRPSYFTGLTAAEHLMLTPIADWPASARQHARDLVATAEGLASLRAASNKKAAVVQFVAVRGL